MKSDFSTFHSQFEDVAERLQSQNSTKTWKTRITYYPDDQNPDGVGIQLSKPGWFNEEGLGIHFETWVTEKEIASKKLKFVLHILHQEFFPGTEKKAWAFLWPFLEDQVVIDFVSEWKGFKMGRSHPIKGERRFKDSLVEVVSEEFTRFALIGDRIDAHLQKVLE